MVLIAWAAVPLLAQVTEFEGVGRRAVQRKVELTVTVSGATLANLVLLDDPDALSPFWNAARAVRLAGGQPERRVVSGIFSAWTDSAPIPGGVEGRLSFSRRSRPHEVRARRIRRSRNASSVTLTARLPLAQEQITRTVQLVDGEQVAYVQTEVESLLSIDRPISWAEHATLGPPFLEPAR